MTERPALVERLHRFVDELRARGVPISLVERIDAMQAVEGISLESRSGLHVALGATLIKNAEHRVVFDDMFDLYFRLGDLPARPEPDEAHPADASRAEEPGVDDRPIDLDASLRDALRDGSEQLARLVAEEAVRRFARFEPGRGAAGVFYEKWTVEGLRLPQVTSSVAAEGGSGGSGEGAGAGSGEGAGAGSGAASSPPPPERSRPDVEANAEVVRQQIRQVIREMLVADRGVDAVAKTLRKPLPADVDISMASLAQMAEIERLLQPLQRKLATTVLRRRRRRVGQLDVRATLRASMATGGVPVRVISRRPVPTKPQLFILADMSGSVATFAAFTIALVAAMSDLFSRLRTFAFEQNAVEVTEILRHTTDSRSALGAITGPGTAHLLGSSTDYGRSLQQFFGEVGPQLGHRSTVLIFGDGRGNYRPAQEATMSAIAQRAGAVYWLNPEPIGLWGTGDSLMNTYRRYCTEAIVCRTLNDLRRFIEEMD